MCFLCLAQVTCAKYMWLAKSDKLCGKFNICVLHCSVQPSATGEQKTKPTQNSVRELRGLGLSPDLVSLLSHSCFYKHCISLRVCVCISCFISCDSTHLFQELLVSTKCLQLLVCSSTRGRPFCVVGLTSFHEVTQ